MTYGSYENAPIVLDPWQVGLLQNQSRLIAVEKAPQIGFSWVMALRELWEALLFENSTSSFVSVDMREANEKILYAKKSYHGLPDIFRDAVPLIKDSMDELWLGNSAAPSRLMSLPSTSALRGRRMSVVGDEVEFFKDAGASTLRVAMGRIQRGGRLCMGSTVFGTDTTLERLMAGDERNFYRMRLPYTVARNPEIISSIEIAKEELPPEDFAEEYECVRGGGVGITFSAELIRRAQHDDPMLVLDDLHSGLPLVMGYDVGTAAHPSVASVLEQRHDGWRQVVLQELRGVELQDQGKLLTELMTRLPQMVLAIDATGLGHQLGQELRSAFGDRVIFLIVGSKPERMPPMSRDEFTIDMQRAMEAGELFIAQDREATKQFHRTRLTAVGKVEQPGSKRKSHYDRYWATAYSWYAARVRNVESVYERRGLIVIGAQ